TRDSSSARICSTSPGPPTAARICSSGTSLPSTVRAACLTDARIIAPESIRVPSRSKRTTGYLTATWYPAAPGLPTARRITVDGSSGALGGGWGHERERALEDDRAAPGREPKRPDDG